MITNFNDIQQAWKTLATNKKNTFENHLSYLIIKTLHSKSNEKLEVAKGLIYKWFTPNKNHEFSKIDDYMRHIRNNHKLDLEKFSRYFGDSLFFMLDDQDKIAYIDLIKKLANEEFIDKTYVYILVREDLPKIQQLVQAAHVTMVLGQEVGKHITNAKTQHFCVLGVKDNKELLKEMTKATSLGLKFSRFFESDIGQYTAIAFYPMRKSVAQRKKLFVEKKLLTFCENVV